MTFGVLVNMFTALIFLRTSSPVKKLRLAESKNGSCGMSVRELELFMNEDLRCIRSKAGRDRSEEEHCIGSGG